MQVWHFKKHILLPNVATSVSIWVKEYQRESAERCVGMAQAIAPVSSRGFFHMSVNWCSVARLTAPFVGIVILFLAPLLFGWRPVLGRSMQPTLPRVGGFFSVTTTLPQVGDLVALESGSAIGRSIKRVKSLTTQGVVVVGDNANNSMDSEWGVGARGKVVVLPLSDVERVGDIWSPTRFSRMFTARGRALNWAQFRYAPHEIFTAGRSVVASRGNKTYLSTPRPRFLPGRFAGFASKGSVRLWDEEERKLYLAELDTQKVTCVEGPRPKVGRIHAVVTRGTGLGLRLVHLPGALNTPFAFRFDGKQYHVAKALIVPCDELLGGGPGTVFVTLPPLEAEGKITVVLESVSAG